MTAGAADRRVRPVGLALVAVVGGVTAFFALRPPAPVESTLEIRRYATRTVEPADVPDEDEILEWRGQFEGVARGLVRDCGLELVAGCEGEVCVAVGDFPTRDGLLGTAAVLWEERTVAAAYLVPWQLDMEYDVLPCGRAIRLRHELEAAAAMMATLEAGRGDRTAQCRLYAAAPIDPHHAARLCERAAEDAYGDPGVFAGAPVLLSRHLP